jgi:putative tryptophan/tyrosine transport system substrate-binding protein
MNASLECKTFDVRRQQFIALFFGSVVTWSSAAIAQPTSRVRRIGVLIGIAESDPEAQARITAFAGALRKLE